METEKKEVGGIFFERIDKAGRPVHYPAWRYHALYEPRIVNDTEQDEQADREGWYSVDAPVTAVQNFSNFYHDLEDMNCRQLCYYAKSEFDADLPVEAPKEKLLWAIYQLAINSPKTKNRIVLLAQSVRMNYDETQKEIRRMAGNLGDCDEVIKEEVWL